MLDEGLEQARLILADATVTLLASALCDGADFARIIRVCETVWSAIRRLKDASIQDGSTLMTWVVTEVERELITSTPAMKQYPDLPDSTHSTDAAYSFVELNGESPAGIAYVDAAYAIFSKLPR